MRDFKRILCGTRLLERIILTLQTLFIHLKQVQKIEFFSADQPSRVRGPRRDRLFHK